jgi:DNA-binding response OmpR family regulator
MQHVLIIAADNEEKAELRSNLKNLGLFCSCVPDDNNLANAVAAADPDVLLFEVDPRAPEIPGSIRRIRHEAGLPVIALLPETLLEKPDLALEVDDFAAFPYSARELALRINRVVRKPPRHDSSEQIKCNSLTIDLATCEVTVNGALVELTFKEYELLKLLAANRGRVFTREALLDKLWGYDYFGGDRTVDVHIRRLRSKIEDADHTYIETVRNIGYRFVKNG